MSKLMTMREAIAHYVPDGTTVLMGGAFETMTPFAAGHELIRQQRRQLTLVGPISDVLFDQLIGAGCVEKVIAAWIGNNSEGVSYCYRRAAEQGIPHAIAIEEHTSFTMVLSLLAAGLNLPYIPTNSALGSDLPVYNSTLRVDRSPLDGTQVLLVPPLRPEVAIIHVQRSDEDGAAHLWGNVGVCEEAILAARQTILVAEEIVPRRVIVSDPNRVLGPSFKVCAVVHEPWGAHPAPVQGHYNRDHPYFHEYAQRTQTVQDFQHWLNEWVSEVPTRVAYLEKLGQTHLRSLAVKDHRYAATVDYGY